MAKRKKSFDKRLLEWSRRLLSYRQKRAGLTLLKFPKGMPKDLRKLRSGLAMHRLLEDCEFQSVLDIGSGNGEYSELLEGRGKTATRFDFGKSRAFDMDTQGDRAVFGDFLTYEFSEQYDCLWAAHVLEHSPDPQAFIKKMRTVCKEGGWLAITVPPAKAQFVGGHTTLWTPGLLLYHLVLAGLDCSQATVLRYGYSISVIVKNAPHQCDMSELAWDLHDIDRLSAAFPAGVSPRCDGDLIGEVYKGAEINFIR